MRIVALLLLLLLSSPLMSTFALADQVVDCRTKPLACNIFMEARGEPLLGQLAVAFVTLNRLQHESFPKTLRGVIFEPKAFSWTTSGTSIVVSTKERNQWENSRLIAKFMYRLYETDPAAYRISDPTHGGLFYHADYVRPSWRNNKQVTASIGRHIFYRKDSDNWPPDL